FGCTPEQVGTGGAKVEKSALHWPGQVERTPFPGCWRLTVPGTAAHLITIGTGFDSHGQGKDSAGGAGRLGYLSDRNNRSAPGVASNPVLRQQPVDVLAWRLRVRVRDFEVIWQGSCRDQNAPSLGCRADHAFLCPGEPGQGVAGMMNGGHHQRHLLRRWHQAL